MDEMVKREEGLRGKATQAHRGWAPHGEINHPGQKSLTGEHSIRAPGLGKVPHFWGRQALHTTSPATTICDISRDREIKKGYATPAWAFWDFADRETVDHLVRFLGTPHFLTFPICGHVFWIYDHHSHDRKHLQQLDWVLLLGRYVLNRATHSSNNWINGFLGGEG